MTSMARRYLVHSAVLFSGLLLSGGALAQPWRQSSIVLPKVRLQVGFPASTTPLVENSIVGIPYQVSVLPGVGGSHPTFDLVVCSGDGGPGERCDVFDQVHARWASPPGRLLQLKVPSGGQALPIRAVACIKAIVANQVVSCGYQLASMEVSRDVVARFIVAVDSITVSHTRAPSEDNVYVAVAGFFSGQRPELLRDCTNVLGIPSIEQPILCKGPARHDIKGLGVGTYSTENMKIGEFQIIPGVGGALSFGFAVFNYGSPIQAPWFTGDMTGSVRGTLIGQIFNPFKSPSADFVSELNGSPWLGCDGPTAAGAYRFLNTNRSDSLDALTKTTGYISSTNSYVVKSQVGCGDDSKYEVKWTVLRTSR